MPVPFLLAALYGHFPWSPVFFLVLFWFLICTFLISIHTAQILRKCRALEAREKAYLQGAGEAVFSVDTQCRITLWNPVAAQLTGWKPQEVLGKPYKNFLRFTLDEDGSDCSSFVEEALHSGIARKLSKGVSLFRRDGSKIPISDTALPFLDQEEKVGGVLVIFFDRSGNLSQSESSVEGALKNAKSHSVLEKVQHQLLQQERLRALGQMASGIAHDFNNALAPILGYSELMLDMPHILTEKEKALGYLRTINIAAKDAANIVRHLREFYRPREADESFSAVDMNHLIKQAVILTQPKWKTQALTNGITIRVDAELTPRIDFVEGNEAELREILTNFIFNAVDSMPDGGTISLRTSQKENKILFEIEDTGVGMTEEVKQRCFEPFFTTKGEHGTGLGLAMVYGILHRHNGIIEVQSAPGKGTNFSIYLPVYQGGKAVPLADQSLMIGSSLKILYIEDEDAIREVISQYLKRDGHIVDTAPNGVEGLKRFLSHYYDLVITDKAMPGMSGIQLAKAIKKEAPDKPIILLSGTDDEEATEEGIVDAMTLKPVTLETLRRILFDLTFKGALRKKPSVSGPS